MKRRERLEIIHDILQAIQSKDMGKGVKLTHIIYRSNLSHKLLSEYLTELLAKGLVEQNTNTYKITPKAFDFIKEFQMIRKFMESYGLG